MARTDVFYPLMGEWKSLSDMPHRRDHTIAVGNTRSIYLLGGRTSDFHEEDNYDAFPGKTIGQVDRLDLQTNRWSTLLKTLPVPTDGGGAALFDGKIYYLGGETAQLEAHDEIQVYDLESENWSVDGRLQTGRHGSQIVLFRRSDVLC